jgi:hypothetical protein
MGFRVVVLQGGAGANKVAAAAMAGGDEDERTKGSRDKGNWLREWGRVG